MTQDELSELDATLDAGERAAECAVFPEPEDARHTADGVPGSLAWAAGRLRGRPTVGVCVTARDEGPLVLDTVLSLLHAGVDQIVVVDDASEDGCCDPSRLPAQVDLVRHNRPVGVSRSRQAGFDCLWTDVLATCDGHVIAPEGSAFRDAAAASKDAEAMVCASSKPMAHSDWVARGASLKMSTKCWAMLVPLDASGRRESRYKRCSGLFGSVYMAPRSVWRRINGFVPNGLYGYNEQTLAMQCYFSGVPIVWDGVLVCSHWLKPKVAHPIFKDTIFHNATDAHYALFSSQWFQEWWRPGILRRHKGLKGWSPTPELDAWRERFLAGRAKTDEEFFLDIVAPGVPHEEFFPSRKRDSGGRL